LRGSHRTRHTGEYDAVTADVTGRRHGVTEAGRPPGRPDEAAAKAAWLAKLEAPTWDRQHFSPTSAPAAPAHVAPAVAPWPTLGAEAAAKAAWLSKLEAPTWGSTAAGTTAPLATETPTTAPHVAETPTRKPISKLICKPADVKPVAKYVAAVLAEAAPAPA
jgi:hypothetical protein